jgi:hypothetical protein
MIWAGEKLSDVGRHREKVSDVASLHAATVIRAGKEVGDVTGPHVSMLPGSRQAKNLIASGSHRH